MPHSMDSGLHTPVQQQFYNMMVHSFIKKTLTAFHLAYLLGAERRGRRQGQEQADGPGASYQSSCCRRALLQHPFSSRRKTRESNHPLLIENVLSNTGFKSLDGDTPKGFFCSLNKSILVKSMAMTNSNVKEALDGGTVLKLK